MAVCATDGEGPTATRDTVPVGRMGPVVEGVTTAVNATCWLTVEVRDDDKTLVVVESLETLCDGTAGGEVSPTPGS